MRKITLLFVCACYCFFAFAQNQKAKISITALSDQNTAIENATVELLKAKDSVLLKTALSDKTGLAEFENINPGNYIIRISAVGSNTTYTQPFILNEGQSSLTLPKLHLLPKQGSQLQAVTVTAKKPFIQKLSDRIVVNVDNGIVNAGSSAIEVLERSPGVTIDQNDAISLRGKAGVIVMIDGKPSAMSGTDLGNYLRGLPANAIDRIDIITNPSAKYDAAGNSGIIDIRMKKDQRLGANGTFTAGFGQGIYPKANAGTTFNYRNKKVNVFGNYNYAYRKGLNHLIINRNFFDNGKFIGSDDKDNYARLPFYSNTARLGADFFPSKNTIIGFVVNGSFNRFNRRSDMKTTVYDDLHQPEYRFSSVATNKDHFENVVSNINFKHKFDSTGKELNADVDYGVFNSASLTRTSSAFYEISGTPKSDDEILDGDQAGNLKFKTAKRIMSTR
jgi:iron complex outermembrane recepter protein